MGEPKIEVPAWHEPARVIPPWEGAMLVNGHRVVTLDEGYVGTVYNVDMFGRRCPQVDAFDGGRQPPIDLADPETCRAYEWRLARRLGMPEDLAGPVGFTFDTDGCWIFYAMRWSPQDRRCTWTWSITLFFPERPDDTPEGRRLALALAWSWVPWSKRSLVGNDPPK